MQNKLGAGQLWGIVLAAGDGTRVRTFLSNLCGNRGIKQFCTIIGHRSMLEHTLARVEMLIPRQRILVVVSSDHQPEVAQQLTHWPHENVIMQPEDRDTTAGILLPLIHIAKRDPSATVAIFPSDHFIANEQRFMDFVQHAVSETYLFPESFILLGMTPDRVENGYGWIEAAGTEKHRLTRSVTKFFEKPSTAQAEILWQQRALWNSFVCVTKCHTLWEMVREAAPDTYLQFLRIYRALGTPDAQHIIRRTYRHLRAVNFSSGVCEPWATTLRVLPVPNVGWSDWGNVERIVETVEQLGKKSELLARLNRPQYSRFAPALLEA
jgi:mannose-1-phosphate guanylyltransferase